jgi:hypothetical protein
VKTEQANLKASPTATHSASVRSSHPEQTVGAGDFGEQNMTTTPETIAELKRLLAEATPGPVSEQPVVSSAEPDTLNWFATSEDYREITGGKGYTPEGFTLTGCIAPADMKCLAAARNALPSLLSDLEAAQKREQVLREALVGIFDYWNREENHKAMADACYHTIDAAHAALAATEVKP